ncbi:MAG: RHS repeat-associated core domain-containing protein [Candidatus Aminicenantes bacterium]|nr:RHS repeat-associated core domain-containing protein [Candidatus Aminicenantes bacterium]
MKTSPRSGSTVVFGSPETFFQKGFWSPKASNYGIVNGGASNSEKSLEMRYNRGMRTSNYYKNNHGPVMGVGTEYPHTLRIDRSLPNSPNLESQEQKSAGRIPGKTLETSFTNTYYIWSFDGNLMAEYDHSGICVKEYIYFGNKLVAEYLPVEGKYYYHQSDQVNSTRIVTDGDGSVVYSAAHGPFGDVQKTWVNTYDPKQKFSGKERETYSDLDYFGARYYDSHSYRFVSVDPIRNRDAAIANPQLWNLYAYCRNNPITYLDPDGRKIKITQGQYHDEIKNAVDIGKATQSGQPLFQKLESDPRIITLKGGTIAAQNNKVTCGQKTGHTTKGNFIESVEFTIDFNNIKNFHSDKSGATTVWHELFHASGYLQSSSSTGITWTQAIGLVWKQDQPIQGGQGTGTQRGTAGQFGAKVAQEAATNLILNIMNVFR